MMVLCDRVNEAVITVGQPDECRRNRVSAPDFGGDIMNKEEIIALLKKNIDSLRQFHVTALYLFVSVVRGDEKKTNDIDILVEFEHDAHIGLLEFARLQRTLSEMLGCEVDLATPEALHKSMKGRIMEEAVRAA